MTKDLESDMNIWHRPRIVERKPRKQIPVATGTIFAVRTITVGKKSKTLLFTSAPIVTIAPTPERKERKRKQNAKHQAEYRRRIAEANADAKEYNKKHKNRKKEPEPVRAKTMWVKPSQNDNFLLDDLVPKLLDLLEEVRDGVDEEVTRSEWREINREIKSRAAKNKK